VNRSERQHPRLQPQSNAAIRGKVHFIGIGGCSMNGLAQILRGRGFEVQGSDSTTSPFTKRLEELGIPVFIGHDPKNVEGCGTVIYSAAIKPDNPERVRARELGIPEIERSVALGIISRSYREVIGIAGCHGKTTITSMLALIAENGGLDATVHVGGMVDFLHGGIRLGSHDLFVTEACEYVESFLTLHPTVVLINNIDNEHLTISRQWITLSMHSENLLQECPPTVCLSAAPTIRMCGNCWTNSAAEKQHTDLTSPIRRIITLRMCIMMDSAALPSTLCTAGKDSEESRFMFPDSTICSMQLQHPPLHLNTARIFKRS